MNLEMHPFTVFDLPEQEPIAEADLVDEPILAIGGIAKMVTHVDLHDRNDPLGYYGGLLDDTKGDVRAASRIIMDRMINHKLF
jgi:hypothetical protein